MILRRYRLKSHSHQIKVHKNFINQANAMRVWISFNLFENKWIEEKKNDVELWKTASIVDCLI